MSYRCQNCKRIVDANDGRLLNLLPAHVSSNYPVLPKYAKNGSFDMANDEYRRNASFHLHRDVTQVLERVMETYGNGDMASVHMLQSLGRHYTNKVRTYLSKAPTKSFVSPAEFINGFWPPSGQTLRSLYDSSEYSPLQPYGYSNYEQNVRECQAVTVKKVTWLPTTGRFKQNMPTKARMGSIASLPESSLELKRSLMCLESHPQNLQMQPMD